VEIVKLQKIGKSVLVNARPERVFEALTNAAELTKWLDEHVEVEPVVGGAYRTWGRHRFDGKATASQKVVAVKQDEELAFEWPFKDKTTIIRIRLTEEGDSTKVELSHEMPENEDEHFYFEVGDFDYLFLYNLKSFCELGKPMYQADYADLKDPVKFKVTIEAPAGDVWHLLTDPKTMDEWISSEATVELSLGGKYSYGWTFEEDGVTIDGGPRKILELEPEKKLTTDWFYGKEPETRVEWVLEGDGGKTVLKLTHSGFGVSTLLPDYEQGWSAFMCILKSKAEGTARVQSL
jgi:uncharacterized protein YndB with AHSA1/START domain